MQSTSEIYHHLDSCHCGYCRDENDVQHPVTVFTYDTTKDAVPYLEPTSTLPIRQQRKRRSRVNRYLAQEALGHLVAPSEPPEDPPFIITIIHAVSSANLPDGWHQTFIDCSRMCEAPLQVEYLLVVDSNERHNLGVFSGSGMKRSLKGVFGSFRIVLNRGAQLPQDRWNIGALLAHPKSLKVAVSNVQSTANPILKPGWDSQILKDLASMKHEWALKDFPDGARFVKVESLERKLFVVKERTTPIHA